MLKYTVRYESDGQVTRIHYEMPDTASEREIIEKGAALLFLNDCCPGEDFCCYQDDDRDLAVISEETHEKIHHYYANADDLWPTGDDIEIMDL